MRALTTIMLVLFLTACSKAKPPTAKEAADKLAAAGILTNCKQAVPRALTARASEYWGCDLPSVPGKGASVLAFADDEAYEATVKAFEAAAMLAGAHRYGNAKVRIFVQMNEGASLETGQKTKAIVEALGTSNVDEVVKQNTVITTSAATPPESPVPVPAPSSSAATTPALKLGRPAMRVSAKEVLEEYKNNEVRADGQYKDKLVQVRGLVGETKKDISGAIYVTIGTGGLLEVPVLQCFAKDGEEKAFAALNKGDTITVAGRVEGLMMNVIVKECVINPDLRICEQFKAEMGGEGTCVQGENTATLKLPNKVEVLPLCVNNKVLFDKVATAASSPKEGMTTLRSEKSLCIAVVGVEKGSLPPDTVAAAQKALDLL